MRTLAGIAVILTALAATLGLSISSSLRGQEWLMGEFTDTTRQQVHASVDALSARLDALDGDTRILAELLERSRGKATADLEAEHRVWEAAFRALAVVVAQYRAITFVDAAGSIQVLAADPTESQQTIDSLMNADARTRARGVRQSPDGARRGCLGLTIVEGVVRNHGGEIVLSSSAGQRTTVTVRWPTIEDRSDAAAVG